MWVHFCVFRYSDFISAVMWPLLNSSLLMETVAVWIATDQADGLDSITSLWQKKSRLYPRQSDKDQKTKRTITQQQVTSEHVVLVRGWSESWLLWSADMLWNRHSFNSTWQFYLRKQSFLIFIFIGAFHTHRLLLLHVEIQYKHI